MNQLFRRHKLALSILLLGLTLILTGTGGTAVIQAADPIIVNCTDGVGDVTALIAAFNQAESDPDEDTIILGEDCSYTLLTPVNSGDPTGLPALEYDLILEGNGATIERGPQAPVFRFLAVDPNVHLTVNNLTLREGSHPTQGGAIDANVGSFLTLNQVVLENNNSKEGGAIYTQGETIIRDSQFIENWTEVGKGGGIYATAALTVERSDLYLNYGEMGGGAIYAESVTVVEDSRFTGNGTGTAVGNGGAILSDSEFTSVLTVSGSHFTYNYASNGGGILAKNVQITDSIFYYNNASSYGGGVFAFDASRGIHGVLFDRNEASSSSGGGLFVSGPLDLQRSYFHNNKSGTIGGGLYLYNSGPTALIANNLWVDNTSAMQAGNAMGLAVASSSSKPFHVRHNTVVHSGSIQTGSGIYIANSYAIFVNNILTGFDIAIHDQSARAFTTANLYFNNGINEQGLVGTPENALVADPKFVAVGNYRLAEGSPAIDSAVVTDTPTDILGSGRSLGSGPDRGAYEFNGETEKIYPVACADGAEGLAGAITAANLHFGPDEIEIEEGCVFELTTASGVYGYGGLDGLPAVLDTLRLAGGGATVQRDGSAAPFRIFENFAPSLTVEDLTMRNGYTEDGNGGGIYAEDGTELTLNDVKLQDNQAGNNGGGIYSSGTLTIENSELSANRAGFSGGGFYANGDLALSHSIVTGNEAEEGNGGGIHMIGDGMIAYTHIAGNGAAGTGGGIFAYNGIDLRSSTLNNNRAGGAGGGLYVHFPYSAATVVNNVWSKNKSDGGGTAVSIRDSNPNDHRIHHNTIVGDGTPERSAIYLYSYGNTPPSFRVENNIIVSPNAVGVLKEGQGTLATKANLYFNNALNEVGATSSSNHVKADPQFRNQTGGDVRLLKGSPAIDSGADLGVLLDRNGVIRPYGGGFDIGAYEYTPNTPPTATDDDYSTLQDTALDVPAPSVLGNDQDTDGDPLGAVVDSQPGNGTLTLKADGSFTYTPDAGFSGSDSFTYRADDYADLSDPATVTIDVLPVGTNLPPTAVPDSYTAEQDTPLAIPAPGLLDNDEDANGDPLKAIVASQPAHGSLTLNANGSFTYTPNTGYAGGDSFTYRANDGKVSSSAALVSITVLPAGTNLPPLAFSNRYNVVQGAALTVAEPGVLGNDQDSDGDELTAVLENQPAHGILVFNSNGSFVYTPDSGFLGLDSFSYRADDGNAQSEPAAVTIRVQPQGGQFHSVLLPLIVKP